MIAVNARNDPRSWLRYVAVSMLLVWTIICIVRTVPVNSATLEWNPEAPPREWRSLVPRTEQLHVVTAWAAVVAFLSSLAPSFSSWGHFHSEERISQRQDRVPPDVVRQSR
jgi:hypothetical protein